MAMAMMPLRGLPAVGERGRRKLGMNAKCTGTLGQHSTAPFRPRVSPGIYGLTSSLLPRPCHLAPCPQPFLALRSQLKLLQHF
jgi:hypothetical protein